MNLSLDFGFEPSALSVGSGQRVAIPKVSYFDDKTAPNTPRGLATQVVDHLIGVKEYCARKWGVQVSGLLAKRIPAKLRKNWYWECDNSAIPLYYLYDDLLKIANSVVEVYGCEALSQYGSLSYIHSTSKADVLTYMLRCPIAAARYDYINKIHRDIGSHFCSGGRLDEHDANLYKEEMFKLNNHTPHSPVPLVTGMRVRFALPVSYVAGGATLSSREFTVKRKGRIVQFIPDGHALLCVEINLRVRNFEVI